MAADCAALPPAGSPAAMMSAASAATEQGRQAVPDFMRNAPRIIMEARELTRPELGREPCAARPSYARNLRGRLNAEIRIGSARDGMPRHCPAHARLQTRDVGLRRPRGIGESRSCGARRPELRAKIWTPPAVQDASVDARH